MKTKNGNKTATQAIGFFVFAMLLISNFSFALTLPVGGSWTEWKDSDDPDATGDWEDIGRFPDLCKNPIAIECQTTSGIDYTQTGQTVTCDASYGFKCVNAENNNSCYDYRVRFYCSNKAPVISGTGGPTNINVNEQGAWSITATDPEGGSLIYNVVWGDENYKAPIYPTVQALSNGQKATFQHTYYQPGTYTIKFTVADTLGATTESTITVNVNGAGTADLAVSDVYAKQSDENINGQRRMDFYVSVKNAGTATSGAFDVNAYVDGQYVSIVKGGNLASGALTTLKFDGGYYSPGTHTIKAVLFPMGADSNPANNEKSVSFYVEPLPSGNKPPVITSTGGPTSIKVGEQGTWSVKAYDPEGKSLSYSVIWGDEIYKSGEKTVQAFTQTATFQHTYYSAGTYTITIIVQDDQGATTQTTITANVGSGPQPVNQPPIVTYIYGPFWNNGPSSLKVGEVGKWRVEASDPEDGTALAISINFGDGSPVQSMSYSPGTITHAYSRAGQFKMTITATDSKGASSSIWGYVYPSDTTSPTPLPDEKLTVNIAGRLVKGSDNAQVTIAEFSEFPGPFDYRAQATLRQIADNYGSRVNFVHMNFPITAFYPEAQKAAEAVECAGDQGRYWEYKEALFNRQPSGIDNAVLQQVAQSLGLGSAFDSCLSSGSKADEVAAQLSEATRLRLEGTPSFIIGKKSGNQVYGYKVVGSRPYDEFKAVVEAAFSLPSSNNRAPVISGVGGPTNINTGETGTWKVSAYDPEKGALTYSVKWGDESQLQVAKPELISGQGGQTATFQHTYYSAGTYTITFTVTDDKGQQAQSTLTVNVGSGKYSVDVGAYAEPSQVKVGDSFKVIGKIAYNPGPSNGEQKFKVVTKYSGSEYNVAPKQKVKLASLEDDVVAILNQYFYGKPSTRPVPSAAPLREQPAPQESATAPAAAQQPASSSPAVSVPTAVAEAIEGKIAAELGRVDYVVLRPGESTSVSAYFTARSAGTKYVTVSVYKEMPYMCVAAPCPSEWKLVGQSTAKVSVVGYEQPPSPPSEGAIKLYKGWNMVSVPVGSAVSMKEVSAACNSKPYAWKLTANGYVKEYTLYPGIGYWIRSSGECEFDVAETGARQAFETPELFAGWNLVAAPESAVSISDYAGTCSISQGPWYYSHELGKPKPEYVYSGTLEPGRAYWVNVPEACMLGGSEQPPAPPQSASASGSGGSN
ncbi:MAG: PKD domain-containing protein [Candidatus Anstonellaceae archaeon]